VVRRPAVYYIAAPYARPKHVIGRSQALSMTEETSANQANFDEVRPLAPAVRVSLL